MTVVKRPSRRAPARAPLSRRFPIGRRVQVYEDVEDHRYAGRYGHVVGVHEQPDPPQYPRGRVAVLLKVDELWARAFGRPEGSRQPNPVWFSPSYLDRSPDA